MKILLDSKQRKLGDRLIILAKRMMMLALLLAPMIAFASVESSLQAVQSKLVGTLLPLAAICGLVIAGFSFVMGHANARQHLFYAIVGAIIGFGSESIIALIRGLIH